VYFSNRQIPQHNFTSYQIDKTSLSICLCFYTPETAGYLVLRRLRFSVISRTIEEAARRIA
jgi:hypothetical protein